MRIRCHFSGSERWDCERRLAFKHKKKEIQKSESNEGKEPKKELKDYMEKIGDTEDVKKVVYAFLRDDGKIDASSEAVMIRTSIGAKLLDIKEIGTVNIDAFNTMLGQIPTDQNRLVAFLLDHKIIDMNEYRDEILHSQKSSAQAQSDTKADNPSASKQISPALQSTRRPGGPSSAQPSKSPKTTVPDMSAKEDTVDAPSSVDKSRSSPADKGSILKDEKYWKERVVREREQSEQMKRDVGYRFKDVTKNNKEEALRALRSEMEEMQQELKQLQRDRNNAADQKMMNRPEAANRYTKATKQRMNEAYMQYSAQLRDVAEQLGPLTKQYNLFNEQHMRLSGGKRFGEWRKDNDSEYAEKLNQQQKRDRTLGMKMDREDAEEKARAAKSKAEGDRVLGLRNRDPVASYFAGKSAENRNRVAGIMGWNPDTMGASVSENDVNFNAKIQGARDRGVNVIQRGNNYAYIDKTGKAGKFVGRGGGQFSVSSGPTSGPRNAQGKKESKFTKEQDALKDKYSDRMLDQLLTEYKDLAGNPDAKKVTDMLFRRMDDWAAHPKDRYEDLAWARSQLEALQKSNKEQAGLKVTRETLRLETDLEEFSLPIDTIDPYLQISVVTPPDAYGKTHRVLIQPNRLQEFWGKNDAQVLEEAGVWFTKDTWKSGKVRGLKFHFTQPGLYNINGTPLPVGIEAEEASKDLRKAREKVVINTMDFPIPDGASTIRVLRLPQRKNVDLPIPRDGGVVDGAMGISLKREKGSKNLRLTFSEEGDFQVQSVNARMERAKNLGKPMRVEKQKASATNPASSESAQQSFNYPGQRIPDFPFPASLYPEQQRNPASVPPCYNFGTEYVIVNGERLPVYRREDEANRMLPIAQGMVKTLRDKQGNPVRVYVVEGPPANPAGAPIDAPAVPDAEPKKEKPPSATPQKPDVVPKGDADPKPPSASAPKPPSIEGMDTLLSKDIREEVLQEKVVSSLKMNPEYTAKSGRLYKYVDGKVYYNSKPKEKNIWGNIEDDRQTLAVVDGKFIEIKIVGEYNSFPRVWQSTDGRLMLDEEGGVVQAKNGIYQYPEKSLFYKTTEGALQECDATGELRKDYITKLKEHFKETEYEVKYEDGLAGAFGGRELRVKLPDYGVVKLFKLSVGMTDGKFSIACVAETTKTFNDFNDVHTAANERKGKILQFRGTIKNVKDAKTSKEQFDTFSRGYAQFQEVKNSFQGVDRITAQLANGVAWAVVESNQKNVPDVLNLEDAVPFIQILEKSLDIGNVPDPNQVDTIVRFYKLQFEKQGKKDGKEKAILLLKSSIDEAKKKENWNRLTQEQKQAVNANEQLLVELKQEVTPQAESAAPKTPAEPAPRSVPEPKPASSKEPSTKSASNDAAQKTNEATKSSATPEPNYESKEVYPTSFWPNEANTPLEYEEALGGFTILSFSQMVERIGSMPLLGREADMLRGTDLEKGGYVSTLYNRIDGCQRILRETDLKSKQSLSKALKTIDALPQYKGLIPLAELAQKNENPKTFARAEAAFLLRERCLNVFREKLKRRVDEIA